MLTSQTTTHEMELRLQSSKLSLKELDDLINECLDVQNYADAKAYAIIYTRRVSPTKKD